MSVVEWPTGPLLSAGSRGDARNVKRATSTTLRLLGAGLLAASVLIGNGQAQGSSFSGALRESANIAADRLVLATSAMSEAPKPEIADREVQLSVERGLEFLASIQQSDGSWINDVGRKLGTDYGAYKVTNKNVGHIGVTALCCMAFISAGHTPISGAYTKTVQRALDYILDNQAPSGQILSNGSRMYAHAFATMLLAEVYGMQHDRRVGAALRDATAFICESQVSDVQSQNFGGWRYEPRQLDADMSITVCQVQALRAARTAGIRIDESYIEAARSYILKTYRETDGAFVYQPQEIYNRDSFALTAAGMVSLQSTGQYTNYRTPEGRNIQFDRSLNYLVRRRPDNPRYRNSSGMHYTDFHFGFWYGHYYAAQAIRQYAHTNARIWEEWNGLNRKNFMAWQQPNGAWIDEVGGTNPHENAYATAMACLILSIPNDFLPIFQH